MTQKSHCWVYTPRKPEMKDTCTPMFIAALFIIARTWKQPRCPSADEWIRKLWYIYTMGWFSNKNLQEPLGCGWKEGALGRPSRTIADAAEPCCWARACHKTNPLRVKRRLGH